MLKDEGLQKECCYPEMIVAFKHLCHKGDFERARKLMLRTINAAHTILGADSKVVSDPIAIIQER